MKFITYARVPFEIIFVKIKIIELKLRDLYFSFKYSIIRVWKGGVIMVGKVKTKMDKGYGFISRDGEAKDLFFHSNDLVGVTFDELQVGADVTFEVVDGAKGKSAKNVKLA